MTACIGISFPQTDLILEELQKLAVDIKIFCRATYTVEHRPMKSGRAILGIYGQTRWALRELQVVVKRNLLGLE